MKSPVFALLALLAFALGAGAAGPRAAASGGESPLFWHRPPTHANHAPLGGVDADPAAPGHFLSLVNTTAGPETLHSADHGRTWAVTAAAPPRDPRFSYRLAYGQQPNTHYAYGPVSIYKTTDNGASWSQLPYQTACNAIGPLIAHPVSPTILYAGTANGFARSLDGGQTWVSPSAKGGCFGGPHAFTLAAGVDQPAVLYAGEYDNYGGGVYRSADYGASWAPVRTGLPVVLGSSPQRFQAVRKVLVDPRNANLAYAQTEAGEIYKTSNGGQQWSLLISAPGGDFVTMISIEPTHGHRIYGSGAIGHGEDGVWVIEDGAGSWRRLPIVNQGGGGPIVVDPADETRIINWDISRLIITHVARSQVALPVVAVPEN